MKIRRKTIEELRKLKTAHITEDGKEQLNPVPVEIDSGLKRPLTLQEQIQRVLRTQVSVQAMEQGRESWEEANDFDVNDSYEEEIYDTRYTIMDEEEPVGAVLFNKNQSPDSDGQENPAATESVVPGPGQNETPPKDQQTEVQQTPAEKGGV